MRTSPDFFRAVMRMAHLQSLKQAEEAATAVVLLTKAKFGAKKMPKGSDLSSPGAHDDRKSGGDVQIDDYEMDERLFEIGEVEE